MSKGYVDPRLWDDVVGLPLAAQAIWAALLNHQFGQLCPGLIRVDIRALAFERRVPIKAVVAAVDELKRSGLLQYDTQHRLFRVPRAPLYVAKPGPNNINSWWRHWQTMPDSSLKYEHIGSLRMACDLRGREAVAKQWMETFQTVSGDEVKQYVSGNLELPFTSCSSGTPSPTGSPTPFEPRSNGADPDTETDQEPKTKTKKSGSGEAPNPEVKLAIDGFHALFKAHRDVPPAWDGKEVKWMAELVVVAKGAAEVLRRAAIMFESVPAWPADGGGDLDTLRRHFNRYASAAPKAAGKGAARGSGYSSAELVAMARELAEGEGT